MKTRIKIHGILIFIAVLMIAFFPAKFLRAAGTRFDAAAAVCGMAAILFGQLLRISSRGYKAEHSLESKALVKGGPYAIVRNPMYLGILLIGLGVVLFLFKWWVALVFLAFFVSGYIRLIYAEEKKLSACFGKEYLDYQKQVPRRLCPGPAVFFTFGAAGSFPLKLPWVRKEIGSIISLIAAILIIAAWRDPRQLPAAVGLIVLFWSLVFLQIRRYENTAK